MSLLMTRRRRSGWWAAPAGLLLSTAWFVAWVAAFASLLLAFAFLCGLAAILSVLVLVASFAGASGPGPFGVMASAVALGLAILAIRATVAGLRALNRSMEGAPSPAAAPGLGRLDPLWDRDLDAGPWLWTPRLHP